MALSEVLLVEDNEGDALLVGRYLSKTATTDFTLTTVKCLSEAKDHLLTRDVDCILLDLSLPDAVGLETVAAIRGVAPDVPIIVLTGLNDERMAMASLNEGVQEYLNKGEIDGPLLWRAMRYANERKRSELVLRHQALHDGLTGLANRALFVDRLRLALLRLDRAGGNVAVMFIDLDGFKLVNDSLGHDAGDQLMCGVAARMVSVLRPTDLAGRLGGDEFLVLCEAVGSERDALALAERLQGALSVPFTIRGVEVRVSASIGVSLTSDPAGAPDTLLRDADAAMYRAKARGGARCELFDAELYAIAHARLELESELHHAVDRHEFVLHFQPVIDLTDGHITGTEALVRWQHPSGRLMSPSEFIPVAEEIGIIGSVDDFVLGAACRQLAEWNGASDALPMLSVNVSARKLADSSLVKRMASTLDETGLDPGQVCLEVTETSIMEDEDGTLKQLQRLKRLGIRLGIDDFGTGYSSFTYLQRFPFDVLKIDRTFTAGLGSSAEDKAIVEAIISMARALGHTVIAEGVESAEQARHLRALSCQFAQGYYFARPAPAGDIDFTADFSDR
jgi:diguanylate cyclase (GGDEF)-like protein